MHVLSDMQMPRICLFMEPTSYLIYIYIYIIQRRDNLRTKPNTHRAMRVSKVIASCYMLMILMGISLPPIQACGGCRKPPPHCPGKGQRGHCHHDHGPPKVSPHPPVIIPPPAPPYSPPCSPPPPPKVRPPPAPMPPPLAPPAPPAPLPPPPAPKTCPIDALKLGLCLDVLGGLVHIGIGDPVENVCCPVIQGLLELEAAICLCMAIRLKLLNLNIFLPLALQVLANCGKPPPPGFVCPIIS
ncbi:hypothetical protein Dimus_008919 [Dionaea muscipula]